MVTINKNTIKRSSGNACSALKPFSLLHQIPLRPILDGDQTILSSGNACSYLKNKSLLHQIPLRSITDGDLSFMPVQSDEAREEEKAREDHEYRQRTAKSYAMSFGLGLAKNRLNSYKAKPSGNESLGARICETFLDSVGYNINCPTNVRTPDEQLRPVLLFMENTIIFSYSLQFATTKREIFLSCLNYCKSFMSRSITEELYSLHIFEFMEELWTEWDPLDREPTFPQPPPNRGLPPHWKFHKPSDFEDSDIEEKAPASSFTSVNDDDLDLEEKAPASSFPSGRGHTDPMSFSDDLPMSVQSITHLRKFRDLLTNYENLRNTTIFKKLYKFVMYILTMSIFDSVGFSMDNFRFDEFQKEAMRRKYYAGPDFYLCLLDTITFIADRGYEFYQTGDISSLICDPAKYGEWFENVALLKRNYLRINDPETAGFTESSFMSLLSDSIETGRSIIKRTYQLDEFEKRFINNKLNELLIIQDELFSKKHCREDRQPPFSVLISGDSGIGKSTIKDLLFYHFGKVNGLDTDSSFRYTRNAMANYWDGFTSSQWCIVMDDIASVHVTKAPSGDPSLMELLHVVNQVAYVPDQASLNDKGRTPMRPKLVLGTTNTENLNAHAYFSCPSAVQRRFPYIIVPTVKEEYRNTNGMLDTQKVPRNDNYPDYWDWTVKTVEPRSGVQKGNLASTTIILNKESLGTFLNWFNEAINNHNSVQKKVSASIAKLKDVKLCDCCFLPSNMCKASVQSKWILKTLKSKKFRNTLSDFVQTEFFMYLVFFLVVCYSVSYALFILLFLYAILRICLYLRHYFTKICKDSVVNYIIYRTLFDASNKVKNICGFEISAKEYLSKGERFTQYLTQKIKSEHRKPIFLATLLTAVVSIRAIYKGYSMFNKMSAQGGSISIIQKEEEPTANVSKTSKVPTSADGEKFNPWYKDDFNLSEIPLTDQIQCSKSLDFNSFIKKIGKNCIFGCVETNGKYKPFRAVCLTGTIYMTNNHCLPEDIFSFRLSILAHMRSDGITPNCSITLSQDSIFRNKKAEVCFFSISVLPPRSDITDYFSPTPINTRTNAKMLARDSDGSLTTTDISCLSYMGDRQTPLHYGGMYRGYVNRETINGECGSIVVMNTSRGYIITGIHMLGNSPDQMSITRLNSKYYVASTSITSDIIDDGLSYFSMQSCGSDPIPISSEGYTRTLTTLHFKSPIRYIPEGVAEVYGSFTGFRRASKTRVSFTPMKNFLVDKGCVIKHTQPLMVGYLPWRVALLDMIKPHVSIRSTKLQECITSFSNEIISEISDSIKELVHVYDDFTAINGAAGVTYVDKMKRSTSAGNPWKKSKVHFMTSLPPVGDLTDPVAVDSTIMDRVHSIESSYRQGKRAYPHFCAHLKDEPVEFRKRESGKTRVFSGAPMDFSIVTRKYYLSLIRLIQNNRFTFESGPGTISQSTQWDDIYHYLTKFGPNKIVAGDYKSFDKHMHPEFMLGAFEILINICKHSGNYDDEDLAALKSIAHDITYPIMDYNGDLIQFVGVNPSGHPLTVIINGLVNCLYLRYAYCMLNPEHNAENFKQNVSLMTYGDDNIMGISDDIPWFNHTTIQSALSEFDVTYTMADKLAKSVPYIHISDASFLKRSWLYDSDVGYYLCPIEESSIERSLMIWTASKSISPQEQCVEIIKSANDEYFWYGRDKFLEKQKMLKELIEHIDLIDWFDDCPLMTWDDLHIRYRRSSGLTDGLYLDDISPQCEWERLISHANKAKVTSLTKSKSQFRYWGFARCTCRIQNGNCDHYSPGRYPKSLLKDVLASIHKYKNLPQTSSSASSYK